MAQTPQEALIGRGIKGIEAHVISRTFIVDSSLTHAEEWLNKANTPQPAADQAKPVTNYYLDSQAAQSQPLPTAVNSPQLEDLRVAVDTAFAERQITASPAEVIERALGGN